MGPKGAAQRIVTRLDTPRLAYLVEPRLQAGSPSTCGTEPFADAADGLRADSSQRRSMNDPATAENASTTAPRATAAIPCLVLWLVEPAMCPGKKEGSDPAFTVK